jgi:hypothetical protein
MSAVVLTDIVKGDYGSIYSLVWDGWKAYLVLRRDGSGYLYFPSDPRTSYGVRATFLADPQDSVDGQTGPGYLGTPSSLKHRIVFWVDFPKTQQSTQDDQRFDGYFFTQTKDGMAGVTWWNGVPFGFYARFEGNVIG